MMEWWTLEDIELVVKVWEEIVIGYEVELRALKDAKQWAGSTEQREQYQKIIHMKQV